MQVTEDKNNIYLAKIVGVHGIKGLVKIKTFTENAEIFKTDKTFYNQYSEKLHIKISFTKDSVIIANVNDIHDRNIAEKLIGQEIYIARNDLPNEKENEIYFIDLMGMDIISSLTSEKIGIVTDVHNFGASDIIEYKDLNNKQQMLVFNDKFITHIDKKNRKIIVNIFEEI